MPWSFCSPASASTPHGQKQCGWCGRSSRTTNSSRRPTTWRRDCVRAHRSQCERRRKLRYAPDRCHGSKPYVLAKPCARSPTKPKMRPKPVRRQPTVETRRGAARSAYEMASPSDRFLRTPLGGCGAELAERLGIERATHRVLGLERERI